MHKYLFSSTEMILSKVRENNYTLLTALHTYTWGLFINVCNFVDLIVLLLFIQLRTAALRLTVQSWLDIPTFTTRHLHACHHARVPSSEGGTVGEKCPVILPKCRFPRYI
jgi:hypothetical protein